MNLKQSGLEIIESIKLHNKACYEQASKLSQQSREYGAMAKHTEHERLEQYVDEQQQNYYQWLTKFTRRHDEQPTTHDRYMFMKLGIVKSLPRSHDDEQAITYLGLVDVENRQQQRKLASEADRTHRMTLRQSDSTPFEC